MLSDFALLATVLLPFGMAAIGIHIFEQLVQRRLARRFGWKSVLVTGWLGTPIHEFSHAVMCYTFRHRIDEMALFQPDIDSGRLGYVRHSYQKGNWIQELGNLFIGVAPLAGGTAALTTLMFVFYPAITRNLLSTTVTSDGSWWQSLYEPVQYTFFEIFRWEHVQTFRFWIFIYLALCVSSHMAPSRSDYIGAWKPFLFVGLAFTGMFALLSGLGLTEWLTRLFAQISGPLLGMFSLSLGLCGVSAVIVFALTSIWDLFWPFKSRNVRPPEAATKAIDPDPGSRHSE